MFVTAVLSGLPQKATTMIKNREAFQSGDPYKTFSNFLFAVYIVFLIFFALGAARLSYSYNKYLGTSTGLAIVYAILAFAFSEIYYPVYSFFYNPVADMYSNNSGSGNGSNNNRGNNNRGNNRGNNNKA